jgi:hypothetical protein
MNTVQVVRYETPTLRQETGGSQAVYTVGLLFGALGGGLGAGMADSMAKEEGEEVTEECALPDFCELVMNKFVDRVTTEVRAWPEMEVRPKPVERDYDYEDGWLLVIEVKDVRLCQGKGLSTMTTAEMKDPNDTLLWRKTFTYKAKEFARCCDLEELEANQGKLLREEVKFAVDKTVSAFIEHLAGGTKP